jgi:hypothetical protein
MAISCVQHFCYLNELIKQSRKNSCLLVLATEYQFHKHSVKHILFIQNYFHLGQILPTGLQFNAYFPTLAPMFIGNITISSFLHLLKLFDLSLVFAVSILTGVP